MARGSETRGNESENQKQEFRRQNPAGRANTAQYRRRRNYEQDARQSSHPAWHIGRQPKGGLGWTDMPGNRPDREDRDDRIDQGEKQASI
jgi:hypothetical protein